MARWSAPHTRGSLNVPADEDLEIQSAQPVLMLRATVSVQALYARHRRRGQGPITTAG